MIIAVDFSSLNFSCPDLNFWKLFTLQRPLLRINRLAVTLPGLFEMSCSCLLLLGRSNEKTDLYPQPPHYLWYYRPSPYPDSTTSFPTRVLPYLVPPYKGKLFHISSLLFPFSELQSCGILSEIMGSEQHTTGKCQQTNDLCRSSTALSLLSLIFLLHLNNLIIFQLLLSSELMFSCNCLSQAKDIIPRKDPVVMSGPDSTISYV